MNRRSLLGVLLAAPLAAQQPYRFVDLGVLPGAHGSIGRGISADGRTVVGWAGSSAFAWQEGIGMRALPLSAGATSAAARDVDAAGRIVGTMGNPGVAVRWNVDGTITRLGTLSGNRHSEGLATNDAGQITGWSDSLPNTTLFHAFLWQEGTGMVDLTPGSSDTYAYDVNRGGQVVGNGNFGAFRHTPGSGLQWLPAIPGFTFTTAMAINDAGQVAGNTTNAAGSEQRIVRFTDGIGWEVLGGVADDNLASGINAFGQVVGAGRPPAGGRGAFLFTDGLGMQHLNTLIDPATNSFLMQAYAINDRGQISGHGFHNGFAQTRAFRLDPQFLSVTGAGCPGGGQRVPKLGVAGLPRGGERVVILLADGAPNGTALLVLSAAPATAPVHGCTAHVALPALAVTPLPLNGAGQGRLTIDLPQGLPQGPVYLQFLSVDAAAPNGAFALSNGVALQLL